MQIKEVSFEFGMTQNLGDYTNARPSVKLVAELTEDDYLEQALADLQNIARTAVHNLVDDELEAAGRTVKYYRGELHEVYHSDIRQCIVIVRSGTKPPQEKNWKHSDHWGNYIHNGDFPTRMRPHTARRAASAEQQTSGWPIFDCTDDDFGILPPLPDAGPEPVWYQRGLRPYLNNARIDEAHWEELAVLEHVTEEYLEKVYREKVGYGRNSLRGEELLAFIRENRPFEVEPEPEEDDYDDDYDEDDDDEF